MAELTPKQEVFAQAYMQTGGASEAYRRAYDASKMTANSIAVTASRLLDNAKIDLRISELRMQAQQRHQLTVDDLINELEEARIIAMKGEKPQCGAAVNATMGKAKLLGLDCLSLNLDLEAKRLAIEKLRIEVEALAGKDTPTIGGQDRPPEYVIAPDEALPNEPVL